MSAVGGDIREATWSHPTLGNGTIEYKAGEDSTYDPGGHRSDDDDQGISGNGTPIYKVTRGRWSVEGPAMWDMNNNEEIEALALLAKDPVDAEWTFSHINGTVYSGTGRPVGDIKGNANSSTIPLKISGGGELQKTEG